MVFSIRAVPASFHAEALHAFDAQVRACFEQFTCLYPDDEQWMQATLPTASGGLGLRSIAKHSFAAFLASRRSCFELCQELDPSHSLLSGDGSEPSPERLTLDAFNTSVNDDALVPSDSSDKLSQKVLSAAIDTRTFAQLALPARGGLLFQAGPPQPHHSLWRQAVLAGHPQQGSATEPRAGVVRCHAAALATHPFWEC